jgi:hypothetical protein
MRIPYSFLVLNAGMTSPIGEGIRQELEEQGSTRTRDEPGGLGWTRLTGRGFDLNSFPLRRTLRFNAMPYSNMAAMLSLMLTMRRRSVAVYGYRPGE